MFFYVTITSMIAGLPLLVGFEAAPQRILELFRIGHLLAVTADAFGDLHEVRRIDVSAVVQIDFRRDAVRIHFLVHALHRGVLLVVEDNRQVGSL